MPTGEINMGFPDAKKIKEMAEKLDKVDGTLSLSPSASSLERFRFEIQQEFMKYKLEEGISGEELSERLGVDKAKVSKILRHRLDEFSTDRLLKLLSVIRPDLEYKIAS